MRYSYEYKLECIEMYHQGKWPKCPEGITEKRFHNSIREWVRIEESCGAEALRHKAQNKVWSAEEKHELIAKVMAGASNEERITSRADTFRKRRNDSAQSRE